MEDIPNFHCTGCSKCCLEGASRLQAVESDIAMWEERAPHLLDYAVIGGAPGERTGDIWIGPHSGKESTRCRWIRKYPGREAYYCRIYEVRPQVCRRYPTSLEHALYTNCPGVLPHDK